VSPDDQRGGVVEVFTLPSWRVYVAPFALAGLFFVCGLASVLLNGPDGLGLGVFAAGVLAVAAVLWLVRRYAPHRLAVHARGFALGPRFVPWDMIERIELATIQSRVNRITLTFGGGFVLLPTGAVAERAIALIDELRRRAGDPDESPGSARREDRPPTPA